MVPKLIVFDSYLSCLSSSVCLSSPSIFIEGRSSRCAYMMWLPQMSAEVGAAKSDRSNCKRTSVSRRATVNGGLMQLSKRMMLRA